MSNNKVFLGSGSVFFGTASPLIFKIVNGNVRIPLATVVQPAFDHRLSNNISSERYTTEMKCLGWETIRDVINEAVNWSK